MVHWLEYVYKIGSITRMRNIMLHLLKDEIDHAVIEVYDCKGITTNLYPETTRVERYIVIS